jgi:hypothetical protein
MIRSIIVNKILPIVIAIGLLGGAQIFAEAPQLNPHAIVSGRPIREAALLLESEYRTPVTYEESPLLWRGDMSQTEMGQIIPKELSFSLPVELSRKAKKNSQIDRNFLEKIIDAYQMQTDGPHFRVSTSQLGLHIIPSEIHDSRGIWTLAKPILDSIITIPVASRTPGGHFWALCDALTRSSGITVKAAPQWMNQCFAPNGLVPPRSRALTEKEEQEISITWGAQGIAAREALLDLLSPSATTLTWGLLCEPGEEPFCVLNLHSIQIIMEETPRGRLIRSISFDRNRSVIHMPENQEDGRN